MAKTKADFPVSDVRRYLEPGPIVLVSSAWRGETNIMTMGWHSIMDFVPSLVGCMISAGNHSLNLIKRSGECVINVPTTASTAIVIGIGNCSGASVDEFKKFKLTADPATEVEAPLIRECYASFECMVKDDRLVSQYKFFHFRSGQGACGAAAEISADAALYRRRRVHGRGQDHQPRKSAAPADAVAFPRSAQF